MLSSRPALNCAKWASPQADRLVRIQRRQRIAHHRGRRVHAQHDRPAIEAVHPDIFRDLPDHLKHRGFAVARAEKWKHVDRPMDRPLDVVVDQGFEVFALAFIDRAIQRARKTPETVLRHDVRFPKLDWLLSKRPCWASAATPCLDAALNI